MTYEDSRACRGLFELLYKLDIITEGHRLRAVLYTWPDGGISS
jgi:hypothetical protein